MIVKLNGDFPKIRIELIDENYGDSLMLGRLKEIAKQLNVEMHRLEDEDNCYLGYGIEVKTKDQ